MKRQAIRALAMTAALTAAACSGGTVQPVPNGDPLPPSARASSSIANAYAFLDKMMDLYATGSTVRLLRSFDGGGVGNFTDAVTYDDALAVDALLARGTADDVARAKVIGNAFLYVQEHDPAGDGRVRAAYVPKPLAAPADVVATDKTSDVGNMAWVGQALVRLYARTSDSSYRTGATAIAAWIAANAADTRGAGGYTGGQLPGGTNVKWKSTEHNIDVYAFFSMLAAKTGDRTWTTRAATAKRFVSSMWNANQGRFYAGTGNDGVTPNASFKPEDVNTWSYLAFANPAWAAAPDWDVANLAANQGGFSGVSFCSGDRSGVWFEGTAHLADALAIRNGPGDAAKAGTYLNDIAYAQTHGLNGDGLGIVAASKNRLSDCDGDRYFASLHVGATAWYILAATKGNPFK